MDDTGIQAALKPDQWDTLRSLAAECAELDAVTFLEIVLGTEPEPHAAAAALLFRRPFGFSAEMADSLRLLVARVEQAPGGAAADDAVGAALDAARQAEARIRALLPPRGAGE